MKKLGIIFLILVVVLVVLNVFKNQIIKSTVTFGATKVTGAPVKIDSFSISFLKQKVRIKGFKLYNPPNFPKEVLLSMPEISVDLDVAALMKGELHIPLIGVNLEELSVVRNKEGKLNVDALKVAQKPTKAPKEPKEEKPAEMMPMQIDVMHLTIGKVVFKDYTQGEEPKIQVYDVGIKDRSYKNITSAQQFAALIMVEAMKQTAIKGAGIYGAATILGAGFLPAGVAGVLLGKDDAAQEFSQSVSKVFQVSVTALKEMGQVTSEDKNAGVIKGKVDGTDVTINILQTSDDTTKLTVEARKFLIPRPETAGGVLYKISEKLK